MRCATLGSEFAARGHEVVIFVSGSIPEWMEARFVGTEIRVSRHLNVKANRPTPDLGVIDGYGLGSIVGALRLAGLPTVVIDDNGDLPTELASIVVNQNLHADEIDYSRADQALVLTGPRYAIIRSDLTSLDRRQASIKTREVLVCFGGTDPLRLTVPVAQELLGSLESDCRVWVALGGQHPDGPQLDLLLKEHPRLQRARSDLLDAFASTDLAVTGAGSTILETATLSIPTVAVIVADNQLLGSSAAARAGIADVIDARRLSRQQAAEAIAHSAAALATDTARRSEMSLVAKHLFDGRGVQRLADHCEEIVRARQQVRAT